MGQAQTCRQAEHNGQQGRVATHEHQRADHQGNDGAGGHIVVERPLLARRLQPFRQVFRVGDKRRQHLHFSAGLAIGNRLAHPRFQDRVM